MDDQSSQDALHALERWNWNRTAAAEAMAFDKAVEDCWPLLSDTALEAAERTSVTLRSLYDRSNRRLGAFLPEFQDRLRTADSAQNQVFLEEAADWSENQYERLVLDTCVEQEKGMRASGLDDERLTIDDLIERIATFRWQKVAMLVGSIMNVRRGLVDEAVAERVRALVETGVLEAQGDLSKMRSSEVRRATT